MPLNAALAGETEFAFRPGHFYTPLRGQLIIEWDEDLNKVAELEVPWLGGASGSTFNSDGNLVMTGRLVGNSTSLVIEMDQSGNVIRTTPQGTSTGLGGSYIDYNAATDQYVHAAGDTVRILDGEFELVDESAESLRRSTGVHWLSTGDVFAIDGLNEQSYLFGSDLSTSLEIGSPAAPGFYAGIEIVGSQVYGGTVSGDLRMYDLDTGLTTELVSDVGVGAMIDIEMDDSGNIYTTSGFNVLRKYSPSGELLAINGTGMGGDNIAYFNIPSPASMLILVPAMVTARRRRI
ncbi:MAG: hypothetical protein AAF432_07260 [Planctomycetota bacterium]